MGKKFFVLPPSSRAGYGPENTYFFISAIRTDLEGNFGAIVHLPFSLKIQSFKEQIIKNCFFRALGICWPRLSLLTPSVCRTAVQQKLLTFCDWQYRFTKNAFTRWFSWNCLTLPLKFILSNRNLANCQFLWIDNICDLSKYATSLNYRSDRKGVVKKGGNWAKRKSL